MTAKPHKTSKIILSNTFIKIILSFILDKLIICREIGVIFWLDRRKPQAL